MTEEFAAGEADAFTAEDEEEREHHLFEDCPMPILPCSVKHGATTTPIRVLIDSGASVDLVNEKLARKLKGYGVQHVEELNPMTVKVANGSKCKISQSMVLTLQFGAVVAEAQKFLIMSDLPFDVILGTETLEKWQATLNWGKRNFSMRPGASAAPVELHWITHKGQHWRRPITLVTSETIVIPSQTQVAVPVIAPAAAEWDGYSTKWGILTPVRSRQILDQKFAVAYMYGESIEKVLVANATSQPLTVKAGTQLAEFHPRGGSAYVFNSEYSDKGSEKKESGECEQEKEEERGCVRESGRRE